ncbi:hypothetical protein Tco_0084207 [Tanacetum coccineum]
MAALESLSKHNMVDYLENDVMESMNFMRSVTSSPQLNSLCSSLYASFRNAKKKFVMYPRFNLVFLTNQLKNVLVLLDHFPINALTTKVFSFMVKKGKKNSGNVTPLFPSMLAQPTEDEGKVLERPSETQPTPSPTHLSTDQSEPQSDPSLRPSSSNPIPNSIPEGSSGFYGGQSLVIDSQFKGLGFDLDIQSLMQKESVSKQRRKPAKSEPTLHKDPAFDDLDDAMDYMETEDAHDEGTMKKQDQKMEIQMKVLLLQLFSDDETIAQFLVTMSQNKTKQKGVEINEIKDTDRPRTTTERSILTLKPLPKIDLKDKGKKVLERKLKISAESEVTRFLLRSFKKKREKKFTIEQRAKFLHDTIAAQRRFLAQQRSEAIRNKLPVRFIQLRNQMMTYLKYVGGYKHAQLNKKKFKEIQVMYEKVKGANKNFIPISSAKDENLIEKMNKKAAGMDKEEVSEEPESTKVKAKIEEPKENIRKRSGRRLKMKAPKSLVMKRFDDETEEIEDVYLNVVIISNRQRRYFNTLMVVFSILDRDDISKLEDKNKYPLKKEVLSQLLEFKLETEEDSTMALELIRFVKKHIAELEPKDSDRDEEDP